MKIIVLILLTISFNWIYASANSFNIRYANIDKPTLGLALSGGGARGISQIGVLKLFQEKGIDISYITGTSIGAIIGGLYASGYSVDNLEHLLVTNNWSEAISLSKNRRNELFIDQKAIYDKSLLTIKFDNFDLIPIDGISKGNPFDTFIQGLFWGSPYQPEINFDSLKIPFRAIATDLVSGKSISFSHGNISKIVRASATIPLRYTPVKIDSMILVDGGILSNIPVEQLKEFNPNIIVAVNTTSPLYNRPDLNYFWKLADQIVSIAMEEFSSKSLEQSDIVIEPQLNRHNNGDFYGLDSLIDMGYQAAKIAYPKLISLINTKLIESIRLSVDSNVINSLHFPLNLNLIDFSENLTKDIAKRYSIINNKSELYELILYIYNNSTKFEELQFTHNSELLSIKFKEKQKITNIEIVSNIGGLDSNAILNYINQKYNAIYRDNTFLANLKDDIYKYLGANNIYFSNVKLSIIQNKLIINLLNNKIFRIDIAGSKVNNFIIRRELLIKEGDVLSVANLQKSWDYLNNTGLFNEVEIYPYRDSNSNLIVRLNLKDGGTQTIRLGGRIDSERNAQGNLFLIQENLFNQGGRLSFNINLSESYFNSKLKFENSRIFNTELSLATELYYNSRDGFEYTLKPNLGSNKYATNKSLNYETSSYGLMLTGGLQIGRDGNFYTRARYEMQKYNRKSDSIKMGYYTLSTIKFGMIWDNLNDINFPTSGRIIELSLETNLIQNNDVVGFSKARFHYNSYTNIGNNIFNTSLLFGAGDATMPYPEFFFGGGMESFFGYGAEELLGRQIFVGSLGYRVDLPFSIFFDTYFFARYDIGNIWEKYEDIKLANLRHGLGLGIAIDTPIGPAKVALGKSLFFTNNLKDVVFGQSILYFSIGLNLN